jgi:hypothetical protein
VLLGSGLGLVWQQIVEASILCRKKLIRRNALPERCAAVLTLGDAAQVWKIASVGARKVW